MVKAFAPGNLVDLRPVTLDGNVLVFTAVVAAATGIVFGFTPALQCSKADLGNTLKEGRSTTGSGRRLRETLVVTEVALSLILLVGAGLLINSFARLTNVDSGIDPANALSVRVSIPATEYSEAIEHCRAGVKPNTIPVTCGQHCSSCKEQCCSSC